MRKVAIQRRYSGCAALDVGVRRLDAADRRRKVSKSETKV
jgi:hypothetical protein